MLEAQGLARQDRAALEDSDGVSENEVRCARDIAVSVKLAVHLGIEGILKCVERTPVHHEEVRLQPECHGLVLHWACSVREPHVPSNKAFSYNSWY